MASLLFQERGQPLFDGGPSWEPKQVFTTGTIASATDIVGTTPPNGGSWIIDDFMVSSDTATVLTVTDSAGSPKTLFVIDVPANLPIPLTPRTGFRQAGAGLTIKATSSVGAGNCRIWISVHEELVKS